MPGTDITVEEEGTVVTILFIKDNLNLPVEVDKISVIVCGELGKNLIYFRRILSTC